MMKLYYSAGSCSTSCHITLEESGLKYEAIEVDWDNAADPNHEVVAKLNPLGTLPILLTEEGKQLDQNVAIHTYIADKAGSKLLGPVGSYERALAMNWLAFATSDLHKSIGALFSTQGFSTVKSEQDAFRKFYKGKSADMLAYLDTKLEGQDYLCGKQFTPADAYVFVVVGWTKWLEIPTTDFKNLERYMARVAARPAVAKVMKEEGLA